MQNAANVTVTNLTVDGGVSDCSLDPIGIFYQNASGTISHNAVRHQALSAALNGCQSGLGIFVQSSSPLSSTVSVTSNVVQDYQKNGITGNEIGTHLTLTSNTVIGQGSTSGAAENGIQIGFGATATLNLNSTLDNIWAPDTISDSGDAATGILIFGSSSVHVTNNTVGNNQFGIAVVTDSTDSLSADHTTITGNNISATRIFDGIDVCSNSNTVQTNTINSSDEAAIHLDSSCGGTGKSNTVRNNVINSACAGILVGTGTSGNTTTPNTFFNTQTAVLNGNQCSTPPVVKTTLRHNYQPSRL